MRGTGCALEFLEKSGLLGRACAILELVGSNGLLRPARYAGQKNKGRRGSSIPRRLRVCGVCQVGVDKKSRIPRRKLTLKAHVVLSAGFILILAGLFLMVNNSDNATRVFVLRPVLILFAGVLFLYMGIAFTSSSSLLFFGIVLVLVGGTFLLADTGVIRYSLKELWPTIVISSGLALFPAGLYKARRIRTVYLFPAIMLVAFGVIFLLFSMHVFPFTFGEFITKWWPLFIMLGGASLVIVFFVQQANVKNFPYMEDDSLVDCEDVKE